VVGCWHSYVSGARCRFAYGPTDATATHYLLILPFWCLVLAHPGSPGQGPEDRKTVAVVVVIDMMHLLLASYIIYTSKLSLFFASDIVFCCSRVANMEIHRQKPVNNNAYLQKQLTNDKINAWRPAIQLTA